MRDRDARTWRVLVGLMGSTLVVAVASTLLPGCGSNSRPYALGGNPNQSPSPPPASPARSGGANRS